MKITRLKIEKLFDLFDYDIQLDNSENLLILTGPNGYGKTMMLNIIDSFLSGKLQFFNNNLIFDKINLFFTDDIEIVITQTNSNNKFRHANVEYKYFKENKEINSMDFEDDYLTRIKVHLIKEQRLLKTIDKKDNVTQVINTINENAKDLSKIIVLNIQESLKIAQALDSSFPKRLLNGMPTKLTPDEFNKRFNLLHDKQQQLKNYDLADSEQDIPQYDEENAKVLLIYLADREKKLSAFDNLLKRLDLFTNILNERRFTHKTIKISKHRGFIFLTNQGKELALTDLSSGEQHEVVLLYELIFNTNSDTLVLIDEPEISLHITWQKEFLNDLIQIIELQKIQVLIATHSPQIINNRWDLVYNLEDKAIAV
ncbi:MAG: AAA family ATPase [Saprospiraceae bacterium]|nr:AAA family ATPase [Saprospiraceae bacterium]